MAKHNGRRGFGSHLQQANEDNQRQRSISAFEGIWTRLILDYDADRDIARFYRRLMQALNERLASAGPHEVLHQRDYLLALILKQREQLPIMTRVLEPESDPYIRKRTFVSYTVLLTDGVEDFRTYKQDSIAYPAPIDQATAEILPQFIFAVETGPNDEDWGSKHVDIFTTDEMLYILAHLWRAYRLATVEEYEALRKQYFNEKWAQVRDAEIEKLRNELRRRNQGVIDLEPTQNEISDRRKAIRQQYKVAIQDTFKATKKRLEAQQGRMQFSAAPDTTSG